MFRRAGFNETLAKNSAVTAVKKTKSKETKTNREEASYAVPYGYV